MFWLSSIQTLPPISREGIYKTNRRMRPEWSSIIATHPVFELQLNILAYFTVSRDTFKSKKNLCAALGEVHELS